MNEQRKSDPTGNASRSQLSQSLNRLYAARTQFFYAVSFIVVIALFIWASKASTSTAVVLVGVASSLLASMIFAGLQVAATSKSSKELLRSSIADAVADASKSSLDEIARVGDQIAAAANDALSSLSRGWTEFIPLAEFPPSVDPGQRFNDDFSAELRQSDRYLFLGLTGRYVGPRLAAVGRRLNDVVVIIGKPDSAEAVKVRREQETPTRLRSETAEQLKNEVDLCLFGLFKHRHLHDSISIYFTTSPDLDRIEILDDCMYLALFSGSEPSVRFPRTIKFSSQSFIYRTAQRSASRITSSRTSVHISLTSATDPEDLMQFYSEHLSRTIDGPEFTTLEAKYDNFKTEFAGQVKLQLRVQP